MKQTYVQCPVTLELIPKSEYHGPSTSKSAYVVADIAPYKSMVTGEMITSRSQHREHLLKHNCFEIGNEVNAMMDAAKPRYQDDSRARKQMIADIMNSKGY